MGSQLDPRAGDQRNYSIRWTLAVLSAIAGIIHLGVVPEHMREYVPYGVFFVAVGVLQLVGSRVLLKRPEARWYLATAVGNGALVLLWVVSRTAGLPVGPMPWAPEQVGLLDVISTVVEVALVFGSVVLLVALGREARWPSDDGDLGFGATPVETPRREAPRRIPELVTVPEAAFLTGVSESTLLQLCQRGALPPKRVGGWFNASTILIHTEDLQLLLRKGSFVAD
jgi:hypothetical protein